MPGPQPHLLHGHPGGNPGGGHHLHLRQHPDEDLWVGAGQGGGPQVRGAGGADDRGDGGGGQRPEGGGGEVDGAGPGRREHRQHPAAQPEGWCELPGAVQPRVPGRGQRRGGPPPPGPGPHRRGADRRGPGRHCGAGGRVPPLGSRGEDHHDEHLVQRTIKAGRQRLPRPADLQHQLDVGGVRGHGGRRVGGRGGHRSGHQDWAQVPAGQRRVRRFLLPEGYPQPGIHQVNIVLILSFLAGSDNLKYLLPSPSPLFCGHFIVYFSMFNSIPRCLLEPRVGGECMANKSAKKMFLKSLKIMF